MPKSVYKRVLIKLSGEALAGEKKSGIDFDVAASVCGAVKACVEYGVQVGLVVGAGNFWRGVKDGGGRVERSRADYMGMLATIMNSIALADTLKTLGVPAVVQSTVAMPRVAETYTRENAVKYLENGEVVIFGGGTGCPYFSTDTAAVLKAAEIGADVILLAKNIDGVYSADPKLDPTAVRYDEISYDEVLAKRLGVMDSTATSMAMDNNIPVFVFELKDPRNIVRAVRGEKIGTTVR